MTLLAWIVLGLTSGLAWSRMVARPDGGWKVSALVGAAGASSGGMLAGTWARDDGAMLDPLGIVLAVLGAGGALVGHHVILGSPPPPRRPDGR